ncbi:transposase [Pedomonas mirosovicensis]|uniref:transposase n=1 Tax=Pedomonas mirosovicensis TaxID=2908641 RepID=UPI0035BBE703
MDDRASFRRFYGFSGAEPTPERTAFVRFRKVLVTCGLDRTLFKRSRPSSLACRDAPACLRPSAIPRHCGRI